MRNFSFTKVASVLALIFFINLLPAGLKGQAFNFNSFFNYPAITFFSPDSNNMIYSEMHNADEMVQQLDSIFPFYTDEFYGAYPAITTNDTMTFLPGLHEQLVNFDDKAVEVKGAFMLNNKTGYWYAYYKKSIIDTTTAIVILPGSGFHESFQIANDVPFDYHNLNCFIKDKGLEYGDVYMLVKPNEDFRSLWKDTGGNTYNKLDYDVMGPYTDFMGKNWAANLYIELLAQLKYLKSQYKKVIVLGLSNGGFPVLVCGLEADVDGINCAAGISVTSYQGFPVPNSENPYFSDLFNYYSLDHISDMIHRSGTRVLFSYGSADCCTNAYEHDNHAFQDYINTPAEACNGEFFYAFSGHTFPCNGLDDFFTRVIKSPKLDVELPQASCAYDSLQVVFKIKGAPPFSMDLYRNGNYDRHINTTDSFVNLTLYDAGEYYVSNLVDANNYPLCKSKDFNYAKPATMAAFTILKEENSYLVATPTPYTYNWYKDDTFINSTVENTLAPQGSGAYYVLLNDSAGCVYKSNTVIEKFPFGINIYPNPTTGFVNILIDEKLLNNWNYVIYNNLGQQVGIGNSFSPHAQVDIRQFSRGLYHFCIEYHSESGKRIRKTLTVYKY